MHERRLPGRPATTLPVGGTLAAATCTTPTCTTPDGDDADVAAGRLDRRVREGRRAGRGGRRRHATRHADGDLGGGPAVTAAATLTTIAVAVDTLLVDKDTNDPDDSRPTTRPPWTPTAAYGYWDLAEDPEPAASLPHGAHQGRVVHRQQLPGARSRRTRRELAAFLDGGGRLLMSGQDILDQAAGTTAFVHDYLHIDWDGTEVQNDKATDGRARGHRQPGDRRPRRRAAGPLGPRGATSRTRSRRSHPATPAFTDDTGQPTP